MLVVQLVVIALAAALTAYLIVHRTTARAAAWSKLVFAGFLTLGVAALLRPDDLSQVARLIGVGRGADLLLYGLVVVFGFTTVVTYLRFLDLEYRYAKLARSIALAQAHSDPSNASVDSTCSD